MATNYYHGLNIRWGTGTASSSAFGIGSVINSVDLDRKSDESEIKNQYGSTLAWVGFDAKTEATFEYVVGKVETAAGDATVVSPTVGDFITVTAGTGGNVTGSFWLCKDVTEKQMNTDCVKVSVKATFYPLITT